MMSLPHIVFVDDEPLVHAALKRQLHGFAREWRMSFLSDPREALDLFSTDPAQVAVLDIRMPHYSGLDLAERLLEQASATQCLILSGSSDFRLAVDAINRGRVFRYYVKPCPTEDLVEGIRAALEQTRNQPVGQTARAEATPDAAAPALDALAIGVIVAGPGGRLIHANRAAAALLSAGDGLFLDPNGIVRACRAEDTARLHGTAAREPDGIALSVERNRSAAPLRILATPLGKDGRIAYFVNDPDRLPPVDPARLMGLFGLTAAEARLAATLAAGHDLADAAELGGITRETARSYLKQVFLKTGCSRQAELVQTVLTALAPTESR